MIKQFAERQWEIFNETGDCEDLIGFEFEGQFIVNPWMDPTGRFELTTEEAVKLYGDKFLMFCEDAADLEDL